MFFPVGNGDMCLVTLSNGQTILIDMNIRAAADDPHDENYDVVEDLKGRLKRDEQDRLFVDAVLISHPDRDHITGLQNHFHLGAPDEFPEGDQDRILIREMWSSPIVFRRASSTHVLSDDAKAWAREARRRVALFREIGAAVTDGDRILIIGKDKDGKTDDLSQIVIEQYGLVTRVNQGDEGQFEGRVLAPMVVEDDDPELIEILEKNNSSVIMRFSIAAEGHPDCCRFLTGGDAGVGIWERLWSQLQQCGQIDWLSYDVMETPHHCSWRTLSNDRWSELGEDVKVSPEARNALSQTRKGANIVASCNPIKKEEPNPPHERAKREYVSMISSDRFYCTEEYCSEHSRAIEFEISYAGPSMSHRVDPRKAAASIGIAAIPSVARAHG